MTLQEQVNADIVTAMKAKDTVSLRALRSLKAALMHAATMGQLRESIDDQEAIMIFTRLAKQRKDAAEQFTKGGRSDLAQMEMEELEVINRYLPKQMSEEEIKAELQKIISQAGASSAIDFGKVMPVAMKALAGKADGKVISTLLKQLLG